MACKHNAALEDSAKRLGHTVDEFRIYFPHRQSDSNHQTNLE